MRKTSQWCRPSAAGQKRRDDSLATAINNSYKKPLNKEKGSDKIM
jgi:hypothetical protein